MHHIDKRLKQLNIELPQLSQPAGHYQPVQHHNGFLFISGQFPMLNGQLIYQGQIGKEQSIASGCQAAELAALNVLSHLSCATNNWQQFQSLIRIEGHIASAPGFYEQPKILDAASQLFKLILDTQGEHTRTAFAPERLPLNATVELVVIAQMCLI